jgi:hypothetical protein
MPFLVESVKLHKSFSNLQSIPGVSHIISLTIMLETSDIERFANLISWTNI